MELPRLTMVALAGMRRVEDAAAGAQVPAARTASTRLCQALFDAGWPVSVIAHAAGRDWGTIAKRVRRPRQWTGPLGVDIPTAPPPSPRKAVVPLGQREWLRPGEVARLLDKTVDTVSRWRRAGLFPNAAIQPNGFHLFPRTDVTAVNALLDGRPALPRHTFNRPVDPDAAHYGTYPSQHRRRPGGS